MSECIFVSSVQPELKAERAAVRDFVRGDALLRRFFDVFLFESLPASDRRPDAVYLDEVERSAIYLGLLGDEYGTEDAAGVSPTEREFDRAILLLLGRHQRFPRALRKRRGAYASRNLSASAPRPGMIAKIPHRPFPSLIRPL